MKAKTADLIKRAKELVKAGFSPEIAAAMVSHAEAKRKK